MNGSICDNCKKASRCEPYIEVHHNRTTYGHPTDLEFCSLDCVAEWSEKLVTEAKIREEVYRREFEQATRERQIEAVQEAEANAETTPTPEKKRGKR